MRCAVHYGSCVPANGAVPVRLISSTEVAGLLRISRATVLRRVRAGQIRYAQKAPGDNGAYLFDPADILAHLLPTNGTEATQNGHPQARPA